MIDLCVLENALPSSLPPRGLKRTEMNAETKSHQWSEQYRPQSLSDCLLPVRTEQLFKGILAKKQVPNLLLCGPSGSGKTTIARILIESGGLDAIKLNAVKDKSAESIRDRVGGYFSAMGSFFGSQAAFIEEADYLTHDAQMALCDAIDQKQGQASVILTATNLKKIILPLQSRCITVSFELTPSERADLRPAIIARCDEILRQQSVVASDEDVSRIVDQNSPDIRKLINQLQCDFGFH